MAGITKLLSFLVIALILHSCSTSNHKGVMGTKGRSSKSFAKRHQSREYEEANKSDAKKDVVAAQTVVKDKAETAVNQVTENNVVPPAEVNELPPAEEPVVTGNNTTAAQNASEATSAAPEGKTELFAGHVIDPAFGLNTEPVSFSLSNLVNTENTNSLALADQKFKTRIKVYLKNSSLNLASPQKVAQATPSGSSKNTSTKNRWVLYFALAQASIALMLGFKQIFGMLDTPSDAGNKAVSMSYATIGLLGMHALLLIALAKSFFS